MTKKYNVGSSLFEIPATDGFSESEPGLLFLAALNRANEFAEARAKINADPNLSFVGKGAKLKPLEDALWQQIARSVLGLESYSRHLDKLKAEMLDIGSPVSPYDISNDREIREWWRSLPLEGRNQLLGNIQADPERFDGVIKAVLRSPVPLDLGDGEARLLAELNEHARRAERPGLAVKLDDGLTHLGAAQRGMGHVRGLSQVATEWDGAKQLAFVLEAMGEEAAGALGFSGEQIIRAKQAAQAKRLMAA